MINYDNCPSEYLETAKAISQRYPLAFAKNKLDVGDSSSPNDYFVPIDTLPGKIAKDKRRILSGYHLDYAQSVIQEYVNHGLMVENADGEYRTNIFMVPKKVEATQSFTKIDKFWNLFRVGFLPNSTQGIIDKIKIYIYISAAPWSGAEK